MDLNGDGKYSLSMICSGHFSRGLELHDATSRYEQPHWAAYEVTV